MDQVLAGDCSAASILILSLRGIIKIAFSLNLTVYVSSSKHRVATLKKVGKEDEASGVR